MDIKNFSIVRSTDGVEQNRLGKLVICLILRVGKPIQDWERDGSLMILSPGDGIVGQVGKVSWDEKKP